MSAVQAAVRAGIFSRAVEIADGISATSSAQLFRGKERVRWYIHKQYRVVKG